MKTPKIPIGTWGQVPRPNKLVYLDNLKLHFMGGSNIGFWVFQRE